MEECVIELASNINENQRFRVIGWFKPTSDDEGVVSGQISYHISHISPLQPLSAIQKMKKYGASLEPDLNQNSLVYNPDVQSTSHLDICAPNVETSTPNSSPRPPKNYMYDSNDLPVNINDTLNQANLETASVLLNDSNASATRQAGEGSPERS